MGKENAFEKYIDPVSDEGEQISFLNENGQVKKELTLYSPRRVPNPSLVGPKNLIDPEDLPSLPQKKEVKKIDETETDPWWA